MYLNTIYKIQMNNNNKKTLYWMATNKEHFAKRNYKFNTNVARQDVHLERNQVPRHIKE